MPALVEELVRIGPKVFVTGTIVGILAIKHATASIPIVNPSSRERGEHDHVEMPLEHFAFHTSHY